MQSMDMPQHVAIIMDGNGRWAKDRGKMRTFGHKAGVEAVRSAVTYARKNGIKVLTLFAFSSENWNRPTDEVSVLMELFGFVLNTEVRKLKKNGVRLRVIGDLSRFDDALVEKIHKAQEQTADNDALILNIAANYGGRWDIVNASKRVFEDIKKGTLNCDQLDEAVFSSYLSTSDLPELDLLIRTGGDTRVSNFLLWQCAYAEFFFTPTLWPDFNEDEFQQAIDDFTDRQRRFGMTSEQVGNKAQG